MFQQTSTLKKIIEKVKSDIPQIQTRSLNNIYTKITHQIITPQHLLQYPEFPGLLLSWINDNKKKSDMLLKVIHILACFTQTDKGLVLLRQYQCLEFCQQFKIYLIQNERCVDAFVQELENIIRCLLPLGRSDQKINYNNSQSMEKGKLQTKVSEHEHQTQPQKNKSKQTKNNPSAHRIKQTLKFKSQVLPLDQSQDKIIFELLMKAKYASKDTVYLTLTQIRTFVQHYLLNSYRCKGDLISYLCEIISVGIFPQLCLETLAILIHGLIESHKACRIPHRKQLINLTYAKISYIQEMQIQVGVPLAVFENVGSFVVIKQLLIGFRELGCVSLEYMLMVFNRYRYSPQYYISLIQILKTDQISQHEQLIISNIENYCKIFPQKSNQFISLLPENLWRKTKTLAIFSQNTQKITHYNCISKYLENEQFEIVKNLHIMREIVDDLRNGVLGIQVDLGDVGKGKSKGGFRCGIGLYVDVLAVLAISVSRQDHIMSYYSQAQDLVLTLANHKNPQILLTLLQQLIQMLKNQKQLINYPGFIVPKNQVIQTIFTSPQFTKKLLQNSLQNQQCLTIMLYIVLYFIQRDKFKIFTPYISILYALSYHPSQQISNISEMIINKMPKNCAVVCIACKLFTTSVQTRKKLLADLCNTKIQQSYQTDLIQKIEKGHFTNKKKQLKLSSESLDNYFNIIFNPSLELYIRESALGQFIDYMERIESVNNYQFDEALIILVEQIKKINKKEKFDVFQEKFLTLYLVLGYKICGGCENFGIQYLIGLLCKVTSQQCKALILISVYLKLFRSPFSSQLCKNWTMMYYPHIQLLKIPIQHPIKQPQIPKQTQPIEPTSSHQQKQIDIYPPNKLLKTDRLSLQFIKSISQNTQLNLQTIQKLQQEIVAAVTTTDIGKISKLAFLCHQHYRHFNCNKRYRANTRNNVNVDKDISTIKLSKQTIKIVLQYIRTNPIAVDLSTDLISLLKCSQKTHFQTIGNNSHINYLIQSSKHQQITAQHLDKLLKNIQSNITKCKIIRLLTKQNSIRYSMVNQYCSVKIMQMIIGAVRGGQCERGMRVMGLGLLLKLIGTQFRIQENMATLMGLLRSLLYESQLGTCQFVMVLQIYSEIFMKNMDSGGKNQNVKKNINNNKNRGVKNLQEQQHQEQQQQQYSKQLQKEQLHSHNQTADKQTCTIISQICTLLSNCILKDTSNANNHMMLTGCFSFLNNILRTTTPTATHIHKQYFNTITNHPNNILLLSISLLPKKLDNNQQVYMLVTQIYIFMYLFACWSEEIIFVMLNSTEVVSLTLGYIVPVAGLEDVGGDGEMEVRVEMIQAFGRLLYKLASKYNQFVYRLNKSIKNQGTNAEYKLHYTLMSAIPVLKQYHQQSPTNPRHPKLKTKRTHQHIYLKMLCWVLHIWKQQSKILQDQQYIQPLISYAIQVEQIKYLTPLLMKSSIAQKLVCQAGVVLEKYRMQVKVVNQLIYQKCRSTGNGGVKSKSANMSRSIATIQPNLLQQSRNKLHQALLFSITLFNPIPKSEHTINISINTEQLSPSYKQTLTTCLKMIDKIYYYLQLQIDDVQEMSVLLNRLISNLFRNQICARCISYAVNQGNFQIGSKVIYRILNQNQNPSQKQKYTQQSKLKTKTQQQHPNLQVKQQLELLSILSYNESIRSLIIKNKIIEHLINIVISMDENKVCKIDYGFLYYFVSFFSCLSTFKETNAKILNDKKLIDVLAKILGIQHSDVVEEKILELLINLAAFKHSKATFMASKEIHKVCLGLLSEPEYEHKEKILYLIYNILYKNAAAIKIYKKKPIIQLIQQLEGVEEFKAISQAVLEIFNNNQ